MKNYITMYNNRNEDETRLDGLPLDIDALKGMKNKHNEVEEITVEELKTLLQNNDVRLVDVRNPWELQDSGKIGQSTNIPLSEFEAAIQLPDDEFKAKYDMKKPAKDDCNFVIHCRSGGRSMKAAKIAKKNGYICPKSLKGGFLAWQAMIESGSH